MLTYRSPKVFVQFISESRTYVAPEHILSVRTSKAMSSSSSYFEVSFKTSDLETGSNANPVRPAKTGTSTDFWMNVIRPMTVAIIAMGTDQDIKNVQQVLVNMPDGVTPSKFYDSAPTNVRSLIDRTVVMVGLVDEIAFNQVMGQGGPERVLRVAGRDFSRVLMDDSLRRIARAQTARTDERRIITLGDPSDMPANSRVRSVSAQDRDNLLTRASISSRNAFWQNLSQQGVDSKIRMEEAIANTLVNAPSFNVKLDNGDTLQSYFNAAPRVSPELKPVTVRAVLSLFTYNGPVWDAITQMAPAPLAETFVDTVGLKNVLTIRRPPFYRPALMGSMQAKMREFMEQARGAAFKPEIDRVMTALAVDLTEDQFAKEYATIHQEEIIGLALSRSSAGVFSQYQVIPALLMRGEMGEYAAFQGVSASYLYDLPTAVRFGSKILQAVCPWDISRRTQTRAEQRATETANRAADAGAANDLVRQDQRLQRNAAAVSQEQTLSASEAVRLYYYLRDSAAYLNGTITVQARPEIRIGDRVHLPGYDDTIAYVESVQHVYTFGQPFVSQLAVSRGQPLRPTTSRLVSYDVENPKLAMRKGNDDPEPEPTTPSPSNVVPPAPSGFDLFAPRR